LAKRVRHLLVSAYLRRFDAISANTEQSRRAASAMFGIPLTEIQVVYNGIDFSLLAPRRQPEAVRAELGLRKGARLVGTSANLRDCKRVDRLIRAAAILPPQVSLLIIGDGPARPALERLAHNLAVSDRVLFTGRKEAIGDYLQLLDVFVLPSGPEEAFGNSLVEAMGVGIASVVFQDGGGLREHVSHERTGLVVRSQAELEQSLLRLMADRDLRRRLGEAARAAAREKYTLATMVEAYERLYRGAPPAHDVEPALTPARRQAHSA